MAALDFKSYCPFLPIMVDRSTGAMAEATLVPEALGPSNANGKAIESVLEPIATKVDAPKQASKGA